MSDDDRANRMRSKRNKAKKQDGDGESTLKEEREEKMFYLAPEQRKQVDYVYNRLKTEYEYEYDETFLKNRHYYPLVVKHGLDDLEGLEAQEVHTLLTDLGVVDS